MTLHDYSVQKKKKNNIEQIMRQNIHKLTETACFSSEIKREITHFTQLVTLILISPFIYCPLKRDDWCDCERSSALPHFLQMKVHLFIYKIK